ncbi:hypothetical protein [Nostoc sp.]
MPEILRLQPYLKILTERSHSILVTPTLGFEAVCLQRVEAD